MHSFCSLLRGRLETSFTHRGSRSSLHRGCAPDHRGAHRHHGGSVSIRNRDRRQPACCLLSALYRARASFTATERPAPPAQSGRREDESLPRYVVNLRQSLGAVAFVGAEDGQQLGRDRRRQVQSLLVLVVGDRRSKARKISTSSSSPAALSAGRRSGTGSSIWIEDRPPAAAYDQVVGTSDVALLVAGWRGGRRLRSRLGGSRRSRR